MLCLDFHRLHELGAEIAKILFDAGMIPEENRAIKRKMTL